MQDTLAAGLPARVTMQVKLVINHTNSTEVTARIYGPGDVTGIDPGQIVRTDPPHQASNFETNYFPAIEFGRPDFPWLFTPARGDGQDRLRPWLCLIVVRKQEGVTLISGPDRPLPVLEIRPPARVDEELPDLAESWAWAHAQVLSGGGLSTAQAIVDNSRQNLSRLLCPRRLEPNNYYLACLVPTFEPGRKAGLGETITDEDEQELAAAWPSADRMQEIALPVYFHWEFSTGPEGDFESLVRLLKPGMLPSDIGLRDMDISDPGWGMPRLSPGLEGAIIGMEGALATAQTQSIPWSDQTRIPFQQALREILNAPEQKETGVLAPPIYGCSQAGQKSLSDDGALWLRELNLDPRYRAAAGYGAMAVRQHQEQLMAAAWRQLGEIENGNRLLRRAQLAREVASFVYEKRLKKLSAEEFMKITAPAHARIRLGQQTVRQQVRGSRLPEAILSAPLRKVVRARGPVARRLATTGDAAKLRLVERLSRGEITSLSPRGAPKGMVTMDDVFRALPDSVKSGSITKEILFKNLTARKLQAMESRPNFSIDRESILAKGAAIPPAISDSLEAIRFRKAAAAHQTFLARTAKPAGPPPKPLDISQIRNGLLGQLDPNLTVLERTRRRIRVSENIWVRKDPLGPIVTHPVFPQPMYEPLRELARDTLLPGLDRVPPNSISLVEINPRFIEAYMVGLNSEMGRELLWREYPSDRSATYFRQFWNVSASLPAPASEGGENLSDIPPIHTWHSDKHLGENLSSPAATGPLVLLIRGELLRRYASAVIYAVKAVWSRDGKRRELGTEERYPLFRGDLPPDTIFLGFNLTKQEALGGRDPNQSPGWFLVIQQQPSHPRFGLDEVDMAAPSIGKNPSSRDELSWGHLAADEQEYQALSHARSLGRLAGMKIDGAVWGNNSAHMAFLTLQKPARIAVHADTIIPIETRQP
jgi:hypothetical protein